MKKLSKVFLIGLFPIAFFSCIKEDAPLKDLPSITFDEKHSKKEKTLKDVMVTMVAHKMNLEMIKEIHASINKTKEFGLDDISYAKELFSPSENKFNKAAIAKSIIRLFTEKSNFHSIKKMAGNPVETQAPPVFEGSDAVEYLYMSPQEIVNNNIQFYWPNSENWDQNTMPLLAIVSEEEIINAYKQEIDINGTVHLTPVLLTEEDTENIPVLIIGNEEIQYELLDDPNVIIIGNGTPTIPPTDTGREIYTLYLGKFRAENLHEPWTRGGPEFIIQFAGTQDFELKTAADTIRFKNLTSKMRYVISMSRKEAKKKKTYEYGMSKPLLTTWIPELLFGHLSIIEEDQGTS